MKRLSRVADVRALTAAWRRRGLRLALVPTMGNLHRGHLALIEEARRRADKIAASIFVNPTQFGPGEDYLGYPRSLPEDLEALRAHGCDLVLTPSAAEIYPGGIASTTLVSVPELSQGLCAAARPGHFSGVASVVARLFNIFLPDVAIFGEKDYQQLLLIQRLVRDLHFGVEVLGHPTVREPSGLALSSRNRYLNAAQQERAAVIYQTLVWVRDQLAGGAAADEGLIEAARRRISDAGLIPEYLAIRRASDLRTPGASDRGLLVLAAARLGAARLIDNLRFERVDQPP